MIEADNKLSYLFNYAFCGTSEVFNNHLTYLSSIAEEEKWTFDEKEPNSILKKYIIETFTRCFEQEKVLYTEDKEYSCFNTGLLTPNGNDIVGFFEKNKRPDTQPWILKGFKDQCSRDLMNLFPDTPELASYTENFEELYFNPENNILVNIDHVLDDNWDRIQKVIPHCKSVVKTLLTGVVDEAKKRIKRNLRLVVPQFYRNEIMYLVPIRIPIDDNKYETMALAVEKTESLQYRANTIFTKEMAYEKARLLMKPESNWLIEK